MRRRIILFTLGGLLACLVLFAALVVSVVNGWQRNWLRREFETRLAEALQTPVSIGALEGPLHRDVTLRAFRIGDASAPTLEIESLRVNFGMPQLTATPMLMISQIDLHRPQLQLRRGPDGHWPWEISGEEDVEFADLLPFAIAVESLVLDAGVVELSDAADDRIRFEIDGAFDGVRADADPAIDKLRVSFAVHRPTANADSALAGSIEASYVGGHLRLEAFRAQGPGIDAQVSGSATLEAIERAVLSVRIDSLDAFDDLLLGDALSLSGSLSMTADLHGAFDWPTGSVVIDAANLGTPDLRVGDLRLELVSEEHGKLRVDALRLSGGSIEVVAEPGAVIIANADQVAVRGLALRGNGGKSALEIELETSLAGSRGLDALLHDLATRVAVQANSWPLEALAPIWNLTGVEITGVLDADLALAGAEAGPQIRGSARLRSGDVRTSDLKVLGLQVDVNVDSVSADPRGVLDWPNGTIVLDATDIHIADLQLGALRLEAVSEEHGKLRVDALRLSGGSVDVAAEPGAVIIADAEQVAVRGLALHGNGGKSALKIELSTSQAGSQGLDLLLHDVETHVEVQAKAWPLETFAPFWHFAGVEVAGLLDADLALTGAEAGPQLRGSAHLTSGDIRTPDAEALGVQTDVDFEGTLAASRATVTASAESISWSNTPLGALRASFEIVDRRDAEIDDFRLSGGLLSISIASGARLRTERGGVSFAEFDLTVEDQPLAVSGWVSATAADGFKVEFPALDAARLTRLASEFGEPAVPIQVAGEIGGHLAWDGPIDDPTLTGTIDWSDARIGELLFDHIAAEVDTERGAVQVETRWTYEDRSALYAEASLPANRILSDPAALLDDQRMSMRMRADGFELAAVSKFLPRSMSGLAGSLTAELRATGGRFPSNVSGELEVDHGSATLRALGAQKLSPISARASLAGDRIQLDRFQIGDEGSRVHGNGKLELSGGRVRDVDLHLAFENYAIDAPGLVKGRLDGPVDLTGTADTLALRGNLELSGLRVQIPEPDAVELKEIRVFSSDENDVDVELREGAPATTPLDLLRLDLDVAVRRNSWARGRGADVELRGNLEAKKDPRGPLSLSGSFNTVRGTYEIYGRRFRIDRGEIVLDGAADVDPVLDVRGEHRVRDVRIFALLEGRLSEPTLRFESEPELSETDIASYLFMGRPADDVGSGQQPALDAAAAQIAAGAALSEFERLFGGALPVDMLDVRMEHNNGEESEVRAGVGKYLGERLFLHYERGFGDESEDELRAEYELTPHWSVESTVSTDDDVGADLIFEAEN